MADTWNINKTISMASGEPEERGITEEFRWNELAYREAGNKLQIG
jgi:hypothetical protein